MTYEANISLVLHRLGCLNKYYFAKLSIVSYITNQCNSTFFLKLLMLFLKLMLYFCFFFFRYSGEHRELGETIDNAANLTWDNVSILVN